MSKKKKLFFSHILAICTMTPFLSLSCEENVSNNIILPNWINSGITTTIAGQGSSSVLPIMSKLIGISNGNLSYDSTGSGGGFKSMNKKTPSQPFAMTSSSKTPGENKSWLNPNLRTVTWSIDAIGVAVHLPKKSKTINNESPIIDIKELAKAYNGEKVTWSKLVINLENENNEFAKVYGREGGKSTSGTTDGFMNTLKKYIKLTKEQKEEFENHKTIPNDQQTPEPNSTAFNFVDQRVGSLTYVSLGFGLKNENNKVKMARIKVNESEIWDPKLENVSLGTYKWTRPFNVIYDVTNSDSIKFVKFLLNKEVQALVKNLDFVDLTKEQIELQNDLEKSDIEMYEKFKYDPNKIKKFKKDKGTNALYGLKI